MAKKKPEQFDENDVLSQLAERVEKAIATIQQLRREREELREKLVGVEEELGRLDSQSLQEENERFRTERDEIRSRLEKLVANLDRIEE